MNTIEIELPVYDDDGIVVDSTSADLNDAQVTDIVAQAVLAVYAARSGNHSEMEIALAELEEALESYGLIEEEKYIPGKPTAG